MAKIALLFRSLPSAARHGLLLFLPLCLAYTSALMYLGPIRPIHDASQYFAMAYNMSKYGVSSSSFEDKADLKPDHLREPVPAFLYAVSFRATRTAVQQRLDCYLSEAMPCGELVRKIAKRVNIALILAVVLGIYVAVWLLTSSHLWSFLAATATATNTVFPSFVSLFTSELPGAAFFIWHSIFLYGAFFSRYWRASAVAAGVCLTALVLTKAIYQYWIPAIAIMAVVAWVLSGKVRNRKFIVATALILAPAVAGVGAWMVRNLVQVNLFTVSDRALSVLLIRAEYTTLSWRDHFGGYAYFTPYVGPRLTEQLFGADTRKLYEFDDPAGLESPRHTDPISAKFLKGELKADEMMAASVRTMLANWPKQLALVPLLAYRGMFVGGCCDIHYNQLPRFWWSPRANRLPMTVFYWAQAFLTALLGPCVLALSVLALRRRDWGVLLFLSPVAYHFLIHAAGTQFLPRFSVPALPSMFVALAVLMSFALLRRSGAAQAAPVGTTDRGADAIDRGADAPEAQQPYDALTGGTTVAVEDQLNRRAISALRQHMRRDTWDSYAEIIAKDRHRFESHLRAAPPADNWRGLLDSLRSISHVRLPILLNDAAAVRSYLELHPAHEGPHVDCDPTRARPLAQLREEFPMASYRPDQVLRAPGLMDMLNDPRLLDLIEQYLGCVPTLYSLNAWWTFPAKDPERMNVQFFHRDVDDWRFVTLFIYLTDVDEQSGPHQVIPGSHTMEGMRRLVGRASYDCERSFAIGMGVEFSRECERVIGDRAESIAGAAGSMFLVNTIALHRGLVPKKNARLIVWARYGLGSNANSSDLIQGPLSRRHVPANLQDTPRNRYVNRMFVDFDRV